MIDVEKLFKQYYDELNRLFAEMKKMHSEIINLEKDIRGAQMQICKINVGVVRELCYNKLEYF